MKTIYILTDRMAIDYILDGDLEGLKEYLSEPESEYLTLSYPISFETEAEVVAFGEGLAFGTDERGLVERLPLNPENPDDAEIIAMFEGK